MINLKCFEDAVSDGFLDEDIVKEIKEELDFIEKSTPNEKRGNDFDRLAAERVQKGIERKLLRKKRQRTIQALRSAEHKARIDAAPVGKKRRAAKSLLSIDAQNEFSGANVAARHEVIRGNAYANLVSFIDTFRSRLAGFKQDLDGLDDAYRGLHGGAKTKQGQVFAKAIQETWEELRLRFNAAGGDILQRDDWGWSQSHDASLIKAAGKEKWLEDVVPLLDRSRMFDAAGKPLVTDSQVTKVASLVYDKATNAELDGPITGGVAERIGHRTLSFRSGDDFLTYHKNYGQGDLLNNIFSEFDRMSRDIAIMEILGPSPNAAIRNIEDLTSKEPTKLSDSVVSVKNLYQEIVGASEEFAETKTAKVMTANRNLLTSARLGSAYVAAALGDPVIAGLTTKVNGMPVWRLAKSWAKQLNPLNADHRKIAAQMGYIHQTWTNNALAMNRVLGDQNVALRGDRALALSNRLADGVIRASGLAAWTEAGRSGLQMEMVGHLTRNAGNTFDDLDGQTKGMLLRYGVTPTEWDLYRATDFWSPEPGVEFILPRCGFR